jgi:hypothetical protein
MCRGLLGGLALIEKLHRNASAMIVDIDLAGLAQANEAGELMATVFWSLAALVVAALVLGLVAWWLRRRLLQQRDDQPMGLTLNDLRRMRDAGHLSDEEFEATRQALLAKREGGERADNDMSAGAEAPTAPQTSTDRPAAPPANTNTDSDNGPAEPADTDDSPDKDEANDAPPDADRDDHTSP